MSKKLAIILTLFLAVIALSGCERSDYGGADLSPEVQDMATGSVTVELETITSNVSIGDYVKAPVYLDTRTSFVNSVQLLLNYNSDLLEFDSVSTIASNFSIWIKKTGSGGQVELVAAEPKPGVNGSKSNMGIIIFKAKAPGTTKISLDQKNSKIFTSDDINMIRSTGHKNVDITIADSAPIKE